MTKNQKVDPFSGVEKRCQSKFNPIKPGGPKDPKRTQLKSHLGVIWNSFGSHLEVFFGNNL